MNQSAYIFFNLASRLREAARNFCVKALESRLSSNPFDSIPYFRLTSDDTSSQSFEVLAPGVTEAGLRKYISWIGEHTTRLPPEQAQLVQHAGMIIAAASTGSALESFEQIIVTTKTPGLLVADTKSLFSNSVEPVIEIAALLKCYEINHFPLPELGIPSAKSEPIFVNEQSLLILEGLIKIGDIWVLDNIKNSLRDNLPPTQIAEIPSAVSWENLEKVYKSGAHIISKIELLPDGMPLHADYLESLSIGLVRFKDRGIALGRTLFCVGGMPTEFVVEDLVALGFEDLLVEKSFIKKDRAKIPMTVIAYTPVDDRAAPNLNRFRARMAGLTIGSLRF